MHKLTLLLATGKGGGGANEGEEDGCTLHFELFILLSLV
jgi:hypothetical protein